MAVSCTHADASCSDIDICCGKASDGDTTLSPIAPVLIGKAPVFLKPSLSKTHASLSKTSSDVIGSKGTGPCCYYKSF